MTSLTTNEAAAQLGIKPRSVVALLQRGRLQGVKHGRDWAIDAGEVDRYQRERQPRGRPRQSPTDAADQAADQS